MSTNPSSQDKEKYIFPPRYGDIEPLAEGGMGAIFKARDPVLDKTVALKFLSYDSWDDEQFVRFQREARALAKLNHPGIGSILDFGTNEHGQPYMVLELIEGSDLEHYSENGRLSLPDILAILIQICEALNHAHSKGIVHRDIKPSNIIVRRDENGNLNATLIDFGIAKIVDAEEQFSTVTKSDTIVGSPLFMSPEQIRNEAISAQSDIYSLGCVLYFLLTGRPPFRGESPLETASMHINCRAPELPPIGNKTLTASMQSILNRCIEKEPSRRFTTVNGLSEALISVPLHTASLEVQKYTATEKAPQKIVPFFVTPVIIIIVLCITAWLLLTPVTMPAISSWEEKQSLAKVKDDSRLFWTEREKPAIPLEIPNSVTKNSYELPTSGMYRWNTKTRRLSILGRPRADDIATMTDLLKKERITTLHINRENLHRLPKSFMQELQKQPELVDLEMIECTDSDLNEIPTIQSLAVFRITSSLFTGSTLKTLSRFPKLRRVCINACQHIDSGFLKDLAKIKLFDGLEITSSRSIKKEDFIELARLPVKFLVLKCSYFEAQNLPLLLRTKTINTLNLEETSVTDTDVKLLQSISTLKILDLTNCSNVTKKTLDQIPPRISVSHD